MLDLARPRVVRAPDFPPGLDWLHTPDGAPLSLAALRGRVVLLDVWTFGCINCRHVLPHLRALEQRFPRTLAVVGVHSGKFVAERQTPRLAHAAARLGATHPLLNDRQFRAWRAWAARAWPTLALVDARGYAAVVQAGELTVDVLAPAIAALVAEAEAAGTLAPVEPAHRAAPDPQPLRYPEKVAVSAPDARGVRRLAIADTGHHRVHVGALDATGTRLTVERVVGRGVATSAVHGLAPQGSTRADLAARADGPADVATFDAPQGLTFAGDALYVADAGNHAVRAIDLATGAVRTIAGTGARRRTRADAAAGAMASPWDVTCLTRDGRPTLAVAMAGTHELWVVDPRTGAARVLAGGRGEGLMDGPRADALLAQPMALATDGATLWCADAESSAIRQLGDDDIVRTLVGTGLFDFGLRDGTGDDARLQHPQGLAVHDDGRLLVSDSYNDALRWLDPRTRAITTWVQGLHEPGGVALAGDRAWVADTNAHRVLALDARAPDGAPAELALA